MKEIGPYIENSAWAAAFAVIVIFADGGWKLLSLLVILCLNMSVWKGKPE